MTILDFDEVNKLVEASVRTQTEDEVVETIRGLLKNAYERAVLDMDEEFDFIYLYYPEMLGIAMEKPIKGLTWEQRVRSWYKGINPNAHDVTSRTSDGGFIPPEEGKTEETPSETPRGNEGAVLGIPDIEAIKRVAETEYHRMYNTGAYDVASEMEKQGYTMYKVWMTMGDEKVRFAHMYIDGMAVPLDEEFFTYDGDSALYPGDFTDPSNNVNCRCWLEYTSEGTL